MADQREPAYPWTKLHAPLVHAKGGLGSPISTLSRKLGARDWSPSSSFFCCSSFLPRVERHSGMSSTKTRASHFSAASLLWETNANPLGNSQFTSFYEDGDNSKKTKNDFKPSYSHFQIPNHIHLIISYLFLSKIESLIQLFPYLSKTKTFSCSSTWP